MDFRPVIVVNSSEAISDKKALKSLKSFLKQHKAEDGIGIDRIPPPIISNIETIISFMSSRALTKESQFSGDMVDKTPKDNFNLMKRKVKGTKHEDVSKDKVEISNTNNVDIASKKIKKKKV